MIVANRLALPSFLSTRASSAPAIFTTYFEFLRLSCSLLPLFGESFPLFSMPSSLFSEKKGGIPHPLKLIFLKMEAEPKRTAYMETSDPYAEAYAKAARATERCQ
jgi:hypothetical protein